MARKKGEKKIVMLETVALTNGLPLRHPDHVRHIYRKNQVIDATRELLEQLDEGGTKYRLFDPKVDELVGDKDVAVADTPPMDPTKDDNRAATKGGSPNADVSALSTEPPEIPEETD